jgi:hypothetical protein
MVGRVRSRGRAAGIGALVVALLLTVPAIATQGQVGATGNAASPTVVAATGGAGVPGAINSTVFDLSTVGYTQSEFLLSGNASSFGFTAGTTNTANGQWSVTADAVQQPYRTRAVVYRPADAAEFNGTVIVEWLNVTNQSDGAIDWIYTHNELIRSGAAYVGVSAQSIGVTAARNADPARYGPAGGNLIHPGDSFSYDIFSQAGQAVRDSSATILGGLTPSRVIAVGESQSGSRLTTYVNALHLLHDVYDGYLIHSRGANGSALRQSPLAAVAAPGPTLIRTDLGVPAFVVQAEGDSRAVRQPDSEIYRLWEIAGSAHLDMYGLGIGQQDPGLDGSAAQQLFNLMLTPTNNPLPGLVPPCTLPVNSGPHHWVIQAAMSSLIRWVETGVAPATAPRLQTTGLATDPLVLDARGNAVGGVRTPHVDVPVATIRGTGNTQLVPGLGFCTLFGVTTPFGTATLESIYPSHTAFVDQWNASVDAAVSAGFMLAADAPRVKAAAANSTVGLRLPAAPSVTAVDAGDSSISVSFAPSGDVDDQWISSYTATCSDGSGSTGSSSGTASPLVVAGLTDGIEHTCTVTATNLRGLGAPSAASSPVVVGVAPTISIASPVDGADFVTGQVVTADFACADETGGSGIASCVGSVAQGASIDTATAGVKTFTVDAADNAGNTTQRSVTYTVTDPPPNVAPTASIIVDVSAGVAPLTVQLDGSGSSDPDGQIQSYQWDFGNGSTASGATASAVFTVPGVYTVSLTVTDDQGATGTSTTQVTVDPPAVPRDAVNLRLTGAANYEYFGPTTGTALRIVRDGFGVRSVTGTETFPSTVSGTATVTVNLQRFLVFNAFTGTVVINDPAAGIRNLSTPIVLGRLASPSSTSVRGSSNWFLPFLRPYTLRFSIDDRG